MNHAATLSPAAPRPAHIPEGAVYDFDMFLDPAYLADPHERILELLRTAPPAMLALKEDIRTLERLSDPEPDPLWLVWDV
jgi:hypothetical protein